MSIQEEFIDGYEKEPLNEIERKEKNHLLFYDPVDQLHITVNGRCWQIKGDHNTVVLPSNIGRKRITILGDPSPVRL